MSPSTPPLDEHVAADEQKHAYPPRDEEVQGQSPPHVHGVFHHLMHTLVSTKRLRDVLQAVVDATVELLRADRVTLINFNLEKERIVHFFKAGPGGEHICRVSFEELWEGLSGWVLRELKPALSPKGRPDPREGPAAQRRRVETNCGSILVVPLRYGDHLIGTMTAINRPDQRDFTEADVELMTATANHAAVAIEHAWLMDRLRRRERALRRHKNRLEQEVARRTQELQETVLQLKQENAERRRAEEALRKSEERFRLLYKEIPLMYFGVAPDGTILSVNRFGALQLGYEVDDLVGRSVLDVFHPDDRSTVADQLRWCLEHPHETHHWQFRKIHRDGQTIWVDEHARAVEYPEGATSILVVCQDITDRKRAEEALIEAKEKAEEMSRLKSTILANMSHEIRTPLTTIIGFADLLAEKLPTEYERFARHIHRNGQRLLDTLSSVLDLSMLESGSLDLYPETFDLVEQVKSQVDLLRPLAEKKKLALRVELPPDPTYVRLDKVCLSRILTNLVRNAVKFTDSGEIRVTVNARGEDAEISVHDTGVGISEEFLPQLFQEFKQESSGLERTHEGIGLGLAITKRLVDVMGGRIHVTSKKYEGSTFTVTFPRVTEVPRNASV